jgi:hypothetical protein
MMALASSVLRAVAEGKQLPYLQALMAAVRVLTHRQLQDFGELLSVTGAIAVA